MKPAGACPTIWNKPYKSSSPTVLPPVIPGTETGVIAAETLALRLGPARQQAGTVMGAAG